MQVDATWCFKRTPQPARERMHWVGYWAASRAACVRQACLIGATPAHLISCALTNPTCQRRHNTHPTGTWSYKAVLYYSMYSRTPANKASSYSASFCFSIKVRLPSGLASIPFGSIIVKADRRKLAAVSAAISAKSSY